MTMPQLLKVAKEEGLTDYTGLKKQDLIFKILKERVKQNGLMFGEGTLEVLPDGFGFLRSPDYNYLPCPDDIYISPSQIRRFGLRTGAVVAGQIRPPKENERYFALLRVEAINYHDPGHPDAESRLRRPDAVAPQRTAAAGNRSDRDQHARHGPGDADRQGPARPDRRAAAHRQDHPAAEDGQQRPAQPSRMLRHRAADRRAARGSDRDGAHRQERRTAEVVSSTFDEPASRHVQVSEMVIEKAKRMVEYGTDVVILLDSITRLARAYNTEVPHSGKILSGGVDANALHKPKRFFGAARNIEEGGSLTILATALIDTGSRMDEVIFEEFKGTGNMELHLDRRLVDKRIWPAIDVNRSGTRKEELLMDPEELRRMYILRKVLSDMNPVEAMELLTNRMARTKSNAEFLMSMNLS